MNPILKSVGMRIRVLRKARGMSQEKLAERAGLHFTYVGGVERGERNISVKNLWKIARGLKVEMSDLFAAQLSSRNERLAELAALMKTTDRASADLIVDLAQRVHARRKRSA
jgi:transcriptional regulator with XRE-family HTH domain